MHTILYAAVQRSTGSVDVWRHCKPKSLVPDPPDEDTRKAWETKAQDAISRRMQDVESTMDGNFRRRDTDSLWKNWSRAMEEGLMDAVEMPEPARHAYRGHGQVAFKKCARQRLLEAMDADSSAPATQTCPPGGDLDNPHSASCTAAAARRVGILGTLAAR